MDDCVDETEQMAAATKQAMINSVSPERVLANEEMRAAYAAREALAAAAAAEAAAAAKATAQAAMATAAAAKAAATAAAPAAEGEPGDGATPSPVPLPAVPADEHHAEVQGAPDTAVLVDSSTQVVLPLEEKLVIACPHCDLHLLVAIDNSSRAVRVASLLIGVKATAVAYDDHEESMMIDSGGTLLSPSRDISSNSDPGESLLRVCG